MIPFRTTAPTLGSPAMTMILILVNIAVFVVQIGLPPDAAYEFIYRYALVPAVYSRPDAARAIGLDPTNFAPFITNTFMHGGFLHIILNMWTLWLFGAPLEDAMGKWRFLLLYLFCGLAGSVSHMAFNFSSPVPALGASGAIAGVLGGFTWIYPRARVAVVQPIFIFPLILHLPALLFTGIWFALQVWQGTASLAADPARGGIAWWAHIGGFAAGIGASVYFARRRRRR